MSEFKKYCGNGKAYNNDYGRLEILSICLDDIDEQSITFGTNGKKYARLKVSERQQPDQYGNTLAVQNTQNQANERPAF